MVTCLSLLVTVFSCLFLKLKRILNSLSDNNCSSSYCQQGTGVVYSAAIYIFFTTSDLQFGFKEGFSTMLFTGVLKNTVSWYVHGSTVYSCFLDASKALTLLVTKVCSNVSLLIERNLPSALTRLLLSWYKAQRMQVSWN